MSGALRRVLTAKMLAVSALALSGIQTCSALAAVCVADDRGTSSTTPSNLIAHPVSAIQALQTW